ncbi:VolA/Pla-1 family phospholipase [Colwelliaceae bacterium 6441]
MNKLVISLAIATTLGLTACGDETINDVKKEVAENGPSVDFPGRVVFDPSIGIDGLSVPNDLIFIGSKDGTLEVPGVDPTDISNPLFSVSALDGWSISHPFVLKINFPDGATLDPSSASNPSSIRVFETTMGGDATDADCTAVPRGIACKVVNELVFGQDFYTQPSSDGVVIAPLKPLKGKTTYLVAMTNSLKDLAGTPVVGSSYYDLMRQDINDNPLGDEDQLALQAVINSYEDVVIAEGVDEDSIIYTMAMTTQSTTDVLYTLKSLMANDLQQGIYPSIGMADTGLSVADVLAAQIPAEAVPLYSAANYMRGSITLPYYSGIPSEENPLAPTNTWWTGLCDSGAMLAGVAAQNPAAIPTAPISQTDGMCMAISAAKGLAAPGLRDLGIDTERNLTKYNPVPKPTKMMPIDVQMTTPDLAWANLVRASMEMEPLAEPENGWPVVIMQHGITRSKELMLLLTGALSVNGFATVAIDYPLHGSRGFEVTDKQGNVHVINASDGMGGSTLHYVNLASMLTMRDNTRQSAIDILGLRLGLNFFGGLDSDGNQININSNEVHFMGYSLGGIYGINGVALANTPLAPSVDPLFNITSNVLAMPGLMLATFGMESPAFEGLAKSNLTLSASPEFKALVEDNLPADYTQAQLSAFYEAFYSHLDASQQAGLDAGFALFTLIAQTVTDSGDSVAFIDALAATETPTLLFEVVGNGADNLPDQTVTNTTPFSPLGGTEPLIKVLDLQSINATSQGSGVVRYINGHHGSLVDPRPDPIASPDTELSGRVTKEMQSQMVSFYATQGKMVVVNDTEVIQ